MTIPTLLYGRERSVKKKKKVGKIQEAKTKLLRNVEPNFTQLKTTI
jgi:hypothetical protein